MVVGVFFVFLAVFISHLIPFLPVPGYLATVTYVTSARGNIMDTAAVALATAFGAALGKLVVFLYGYGVGKVVIGEELVYAKKLFDKVSKWGIDVAVFIFAVSPLVDDVLYIPLGVAGYNVRRFFFSLLAGKLVLATAIVIFADATLAVLDQVFGNSWISSAVLAAITIVLTILVLRIKWSKVLAAYETGGVRKAVKAALRSIVGK